jgi:dTDP-4-dehydrorhamnose reductase
MRVLVTGAAGLLGAAIVREFATGADVVALDHSALDISDDRAVADAVAAARPDLIVNCAAFNDVDAAEDAAALALRVNAFGVLTLTHAARGVSGTLVHYSTDFVFDGETDRPYSEADEPNPGSVYGMSKLLGDWFALEHPRGYVLRVESLFGEPAAGRTRRGSLGTILARIERGDDVPVFVDRTVSPSYTADVARATRELIEKRAPPGLYHCVNSGTARWDQIAAEAARLLDRPLRTIPLTLATASLKAPRPRYCALSNARLQDAGVVMPPWQDALARYLAAAGRQ